jgi:hypothetical protein
MKIATFTILSRSGRFGCPPTGESSAGNPSGRLRGTSAQADSETKTLIRRGALTVFPRWRLWPHVSPALFLKLHDPGNSRR